MKLSHVKIKNFRSIREGQIDFVPGCRALIGINESGKTNILNALSMLSDDIDPSPNDVREPLEDELPIEQAHVWFVFRFTTADKVSIARNIRLKALIGPDTRPLFSDSKITFAEFTKTINEGLYTIDLLTQSKSASYWAIAKRDIADGWYEPKDGLPPSATVTVAGVAVPISSYSILSRDAISSESLAHCKPLTFSKLQTTIGSAVMSQVTDSLPECFLWNYSDSQLLPPAVPVSSFVSSPTEYEPLRQMFLLAGYSDIPAAIADAQSKRNGLRNTLRRVSKAATKHMKAVWRDYKGLEINVEPNGLNIEINIRDTYNLYDFSRRSDGFKRFISFLFLVSAKTATGTLRDVLYLHDEPDIGLHPSGARHLLSELIKVSKQNYVVFSTHSIFMIDRNRIDRHYIVTKNKELTSLTVADASNFRDEEVLFNALEFSAFQLLQERNILFEGWKDKRLFEIAISGKSDLARSLAQGAKGVGFCHAQGVKDIPKVSSLLEMAKRQWIVISDGDKPAIEHQKSYTWQGKWHRYDQFVSENPIVTAEDFLDAKLVRGALSRICKRHSFAMPKDLSIPDYGVLDSLKKQLGTKGLAIEDIRVIISEVKDELIEDAKPSDLKEQYFQVMKKALAQLNEREDGGKEAMRPNCTE